MLINAVKATLLISAANLAVEGSALQRKSIIVNKRHYGGTSCKSLYSCQVPTGNDESDGYGSAESDGDTWVGSGGHEVPAPTWGQFGGGVQVSGGVDVMVQGWASLTLGFKNLETTFSRGASVDVAIQAAISLQAQVQLVTTRYASCGCSASSEARAAFEQMVVQFSSSMQLCLQTGQQRYGGQWQTRFQPIFQQYSLAFKSLEIIAQSLQVNLRVTLQRAHVNVQLFAAAGLNIPVLSLSPGQPGSDVAVSGGVQVSGGLNVMVQGWASLTSACQKLQATFSSGASIDVAVQAASAFRAQVQLVSTRYASCGCSASSGARAAFEQMATQFFSSMQLCLEAGQQKYGAGWKTRFEPIFQQCSPAFKSLQVIAASLQVNLSATIQRARVNVNLFAAVGLNLSALLDVRHSFGLLKF